MDYYQKYLKYKNKYIELKRSFNLKNKKGGDVNSKPESSFTEWMKKNNPKEYEELFEVETVSGEAIKGVEEKQLNVEVKDEKLIGGSKTPESWSYIIQNLKRILESDGKLTIKISELSDPFHPLLHDSDYGGVVFWHNNGDKTIKDDVNAITVIIQDTKKWDPADFGAAGNGIVHNKLYKDLFGQSIHVTGPSTAACFSGFSFIYNKGKESWVVKFSSWFANSNTIWAGDIPLCQNNSNKMTTSGEAAMIIGAVNQWITKGVGSTVELTEIPVEWEGIKFLHDRYQWVLHDYDRDFPYQPARWAKLPENHDPEGPRCTDR